MSVQLISLLWTKDVSGSTQTVLSVLCDFANDQGICWPSQQLVAWKVGCTTRTVRSVIADMEAQGVIDTLEDGRGRGRSSVLQLHIHLLPDKPPYTPTEKEENISSFGFGKRKPGVAKAEAGRKKSGSPASVKAETAISYEPSIEPSIEPSGNGPVSAETGDRPSAPKYVAHEPLKPMTRGEADGFGGGHSARVIPSNSPEARQPGETAAQRDSRWTAIIALYDAYCRGAGIRREIPEYESRRNLATASLEHAVGRITPAKLEAMTAWLRQVRKDRGIKKTVEVQQVLEAETEYDDRQQSGGDTSEAMERYHRLQGISDQGLLMGRGDEAELEQLRARFGPLKTHFNRGGRR